MIMSPLINDSLSINVLVQGSRVVSPSQSHSIPHSHSHSHERAQTAIPYSYLQTHTTYSLSLNQKLQTHTHRTVSFNNPNTQKTPPYAPIQKGGGDPAMLALVDTLATLPASLRVAEAVPEWESVPIPKGFDRTSICVKQRDGRVLARLSLFPFWVVLVWVIVAPMSKADGQRGGKNRPSRSYTFLGIDRLRWGDSKWRVTEMEDVTRWVWGKEVGEKKYRRKRWVKEVGDSTFMFTRLHVHWSTGAKKWTASCITQINAIGLGVVFRVKGSWVRGRDCCNVASHQSSP